MTNTQTYGGWWGGNREDVQACVTFPIFSVIPCMNGVFRWSYWGIGLWATLNISVVVFSSNSYSSRPGRPPKRSLPISLHHHLHGVHATGHPLDILKRQKLDNGRFHFYPPHSSLYTTYPPLLYPHSSPIPALDTTNLDRFSLPPPHLNTSLPPIRYHPLPTSLLYPLPSLFCQPISQVGSIPSGS